jgi:hypothetical protein
MSEVRRLPRWRRNPIQGLGLRSTTVRSLHGTRSGGLASPSRWVFARAGLYPQDQSQRGKNRRSLEDLKRLIRADVLRLACDTAARQGKAAVNAPQSRRFAMFEDAGQNQTCHGVRLRAQRDAALGEVMTQSATVRARRKRRRRYALPAQSKMICQVRGHRAIAPAFGVRWL